MKKNNNKKSNRKKWLFIGLPPVLILLFMGWYQLFYKSKRVEGGFIKPGKVFTAHTAQVRSVRFSPDGEMLASGSVDHTVQIWRKSDREVIRTLKHTEGVTCLDFTPDGHFLVTGSYDGVVRTWRVADGALLKEMKGHRQTVWCVAVSADGKRIASGGEDASVIVWDIESGMKIHTGLGHDRIVWAVRFSPDGKYIASSSFDAAIKIWDNSTGDLLQTINGHSQAVVDIAFNDNGTLLASTSDDKTIKLWSMPAGKLIRSMEVPEHIQAAVFSPGGKRLLTAGRDKPAIGEFLQEIFGDSKYNKGISMRLWDVETGTLLQTMDEHANDVNDVDWSNDGTWIASASEDKTVRLWKVAE